MIEVVVKECDSKRNDFPSKDSIEGEKMIQTVKRESSNDE